MELLMGGAITVDSVAIPSNGVSTSSPRSISRAPLTQIRVNKNGDFVYIKYHFIPKHGTKQLTAEEAIRLSGIDPDYSKRDLWQAIEKGEQIEWTAQVQVMKPSEADAEKLGFDPFDVTKVWPRAQFPMRPFGRMVLNKNPENYHRDVEQAAFSPGSMVPGVEDSPDPLLQFRMFFCNVGPSHLPTAY